MSDLTNNNEFQMARANSVRVLETNILHASDVIYWLDGSSANDEAEMKRVTSPLHISFSQKPGDVKVNHSNGRTAMWRTPRGPMISSRATEEERTINGTSLFNVVGEVQDLSGRYNPQSFSLNMGTSNGVAVVLYPTLPGVRIPPSGVVQGCLQYDGSEEPVSWGLLELEVTLAVNETVLFHAQADKKGDYRISLKRLPPLPENITEYTAVLRLRGSPVASTKVANISDFVVLNLESATVANDFQTEMVLAIRPGEITRIDSFNKTHIAVQAA